MFIADRFGSPYLLPLTSYLLQSVPLTANAIPDPLEATSPPWIEDIIFNLKGQAESYTPLCLVLRSPAPDPATLFSSAGALRSSYKVNIHGWTPGPVASFTKIQCREIPRLHLCLAIRLSIMASTVEVSNWPISFRNV